MCGRFNLSKPAEIEERFGFLDWHDKRVQPRFNIAPSQDILTIMQGADGRRRGQIARWGFVPPWHRTAESGLRQPPINARAETLRDSPLFRDALARTRCLIPATGFFEWQVQPGGRERMPLQIQLKQGELFAFAGLWVPGDQGRPPTAAIVTTVPNDLLRTIHTRMPVILRPEHEAAWLDPTITDPDKLLPLLEPYPADAMRAYPVSARVNSVEHDDPELLEPVAVRPAQLPLV
jgi:putative SOS response-associated peptidase YedK